MWPDVPLFPDRASTMAGEVDALYLFAVGIAIFFSLLIAGLLFFLAMRYFFKPKPIPPAIPNAASCPGKSSVA